LPGIKDEKSGFETDSYPVCCIIFQVRYRFIPGLMGIAMVLLSLAALAWGFWPVRRTSRQATLRVPGGTAQDAHQIRLSWPAWMRLGDSGVIRLVLESVDNPPDAGSQTNRLVESRLEASGLKAIPAGEILEPLLPGRQAVFYWSVLPEHDGENNVVIWVSMRPPPGESDKSGSQALQPGQLLTAQKISIRVVDLFGLDGGMVRLLGGIGMVFGFALCLDGFLLLRKHTWKEAGSDHA
jgi:hypothetical protein